MCRKQQKKQANVPRQQQYGTTTTQCAHYFFSIAQDTWKTFGLMTLKRSCHVGLPQTYHDFKILFADKTCLTSKALFSADKCQLI